MTGSDPADPADFDVTWLGDAQASIRSNSGQVRNAVRGEHAGQQYVAFEYHAWIPETPPGLRIERARKPAHWAVTSAVAFPINAALPALAVRPRTAEDRVFGRFGQKTTLATGHAGLDRAMTITGGNALFAQEFLREPLARALLGPGRTPPWQILNSHVVRLYDAPLPARQVPKDLPVLAAVAQAADRFAAAYQPARYPVEPPRPAWYEDPAGWFGNDPAKEKRTGVRLLAIGSAGLAGTSLPGPTWLTAAALLVGFGGIAAGTTCLMWRQLAPDREQ